MTEDPTADFQEDTTWVNYCRKSAVQHDAGRITIEEYSNGVTLAILSAPISQMERCIELIPSHLAVQYVDFLRRLLEPVDFMPSPKPFMVDTSSEQMIEEKRRELRPKYVRLYQLMRKKAE